MLPNSASHFTFLLFDGFSNMVLANALEPLRDVKMQALGHDVDWTITSLNGQPVKSSSGLSIAPDRAFDAKDLRGNLVLVAGYKLRQQITKPLMAQIRDAARQPGLILALDSAAWLLAEAGLLDGHSATIHWQELDAFQEAFPKVSVTNDRFTRSARFLTCGGASATFEMMMMLIKESFGPMAAFNASNMFAFDQARHSASEKGLNALHHIGSPKLMAALNQMSENIEHPLTTHEIAARIATSERSLNRVFATELGMTPGKYYRLFRLNAARYLAQETRLSIEQIALRCGFSSGASLARSFTAAFGTSLGAIRQRR